MAFPLASTFVFFLFKHEIMHFQNFSKNRMTRKLNLYLAETQSQYNDCFGEVRAISCTLNSYAVELIYEKFIFRTLFNSQASRQDALLEVQRDSISALQKKICSMKCDEFLNAFMLHFVYYVILFRYQVCWII